MCNFDVLYKNVCQMLGVGGTFSGNYRPNSTYDEIYNSRSFANFSCTTQVGKMQIFSTTFVQSCFIPLYETYESVYKVCKNKTLGGKLYS